jgi:hypothetical protein
MIIGGPVSGAAHPLLIIESCLQQLVLIIVVAGAGAGPGGRS